MVGIALTSNWGRDMKGEVSEVRDIPTEIWIKVLSGLAVVTLALTAYIGKSIIYEQKTTNINLNENTKAIIELIGFFQTNSSKISRNITDISEIKGNIEGVNVKVNENSKWIYELRGKHNGQ